ncbi:hypothetical protein GCM10010168_15100 [Actinoplanes ianthinogenes]|uniref:Winged helix DNA-binding domain-containing protein n=1 Tax=Actinoplanes ianthinogenes TaxID=122358 RepID=A0ABN6CJB6_9ACTN|nr:winged helix DNA-binding domain-containing protein [Actinoplanes ianthinogenes]BCJ44697.1 hypothetical protein Aiant_53540 [Actinoplanes ianthinogenes]GGQ99453.1 hypothetical protein GCM10010168_15100 [Actinoplanes ianthinogenes]
MPTLSTRVLNRTYLRRQFLDTPSREGALDVIRHLVALQGQENDSPYLSLRARVAGFRLRDLTELLESRQVVRGALLRGTQHLCAGADYPWLRPTVQVVLERLAQRVGGPDRTALLASVGRILAAEPLSRAELGRRLAADFPGHPPNDLAVAAHLTAPLLHPPPSGSWGFRGRIGCVAADAWLGRPMAVADPATLVRRYLAAYGPASAKDVQTWSGLTRMGAVLHELRGELRVFRDENGVELYDLPDAPLADPDEPVPVVFLPEFDNAVLGHADRGRIIHPGDRALVTPGWSIVRPTVLVDGFVAATWERTGGELRISPFTGWSGPVRDAVMAEGERLIDAVAAGPARVVVTPKGPSTLPTRRAPLPGGTE